MTTDRATVGCIHRDDIRCESCYWAEESPAARHARERQARIEAQRGDDKWRVHARLCIIGVAATLPQFTADDVWDALAEAGAGDPSEPRLLAPLLARAVHQGVMYDTGYTRPSQRRAGVQLPIYSKGPKP